MDAVDFLKIVIGLDTDEVDKGLASAQKQIFEFSKDVDNVTGKIFGKKGTESLFWLDNNDARDYIGTLVSAQEKVSNLAKFFANARKEAGSLFVFVRGIFASTLFAGGLAWISKFIGSFSEMKKEVSDLNEISKKITGNVEDISAWSNAIEFNGGSAKSFQQTLISLQRDITNLSVTGKSKNKSVLEMLGIDTSNLSGKPVFDLVNEIVKSVEGMDKGQSKDILKKLGFDNDSIELIQSGKKNIDELIAKQKEWGVYTKRDTEAIDKMDKSIKRMNLALKSTFIPLFSRVIGIMSRLMGYVSKAAMWLRTNLDIVRKAVLLLAVAFSGKLFKAIQTLGVMLAKNPFVLFIAGITMLLLLLEDLWTYANGGESAFAGIWENLGTPDELRQNFETVLNFFNTIEKFIDSAQGKFALLFAFLAKGLLAVGAMFGGIPVAIAVALAGILAFVYTYWDELGAAFEALGNLFLGFFGRDGVLAKGLALLLEVANEKWEELKSLFESGASSIAGFLQSAADSARQAWEGFLNWLEEKWLWLKDLLPSFEGIASKLPSFGSSPKLAMAGGGGGSTTLSDDHSVRNVQIYPQTSSAAETAVKTGLNLVPQANGGTK